MMKELEKLIEKIHAGKEYKLGDPWKYSESGTGVIVPILSLKDFTRSYTTLPEVKDQVEIKDTGGISQVEIKGTDQSVFIKSGTIFEGKGTQSRAVDYSVIIEPEKTEKVSVRCIHVSHSIHHGNEFDYNGLTPRAVKCSLMGGDQQKVWESVRNYSSFIGSTFTQTPHLSIMNSVQHDSLPQLRKVAKQLNQNMEQILKEVPCLENQVGAIIIGSGGIEGIEMFDHPDSWKAQYKEVIESYDDVFAEEQTLFSINIEKVNEHIKLFINKLLGAEITSIDDRVHILKFKGYIGEVVLYKNRIIHLFAMKDDMPKESEEKAIVRNIGRSSNYIGATMENPYETMMLHSKPGMDNIMCELKKGPRTYTELKHQYKGSTATLSKRLKEGRDYGLIGQELDIKGRARYYTKRR